jgi:hypothetical protein
MSFKIAKGQMGGPFRNCERKTVKLRGVLREMLRYCIWWRIIAPNNHTSANMWNCMPGTSRDDSWIASLFRQCRQEVGSSSILVTCAQEDVDSNLSNDNDYTERIFASFYSVSLCKFRDTTLKSATTAFVKKFLLHFWVWLRHSTLRRCWEHLMTCRQQITNLVYDTLLSAKMLAYISTGYNIRQLRTVGSRATICSAVLIYVLTINDNSILL